MKRRKDLERDLPRTFRQGGDKVRVYEENDSGPLFIVVGAKHRTESELLGIAKQRASDLLATPAVGGLQ